MKKLIACILLFVCSSNAFANCDWSTIKKLPDGGYEYSPTLHICVGNLVQDNQVKDQQITDLNSAIQLKDLALKASDDRVLLWSKTAGDELDRLNKVSNDQKKNEWLVFGLGALTVIGAGFMTAKLIRN